MNKILAGIGCLGFLVLLSPAAWAQDNSLSPPPAIQPPATLAPAAPAAPSAASHPSSNEAAYTGLPNSPDRFGLGLAIGNVVTGVTGKLWASPTVALQGTIGEGPLGNNLRFHFDLLFSPSQWTSSDSQYTVPIYAGIGGVLYHDFASGNAPSDSEGGFRLPVGCSVLVRGNPIELFFEIAPEFTVRSNTAVRGKYTLNIDGAVGARYFF